MECTANRLEIFKLIFTSWKSFFPRTTYSQDTSHLVEEDDLNNILMLAQYELAGANDYR